MRHGYKGAFEIAATVDYLFGFAASTDAVSNHHFRSIVSLPIWKTSAYETLCKKGQSGGVA